MSALGYIMLGALVLIVLVALALGRTDHARTGAEILDWRLTRSPELEAELEIEDLAQMLEAQNERRRRRGEPERNIEDVEMVVMEHQREQRARAEAYRQEEQAADPAELAAMLATVNERRRARGEAALTLEQLQAEL